MMPSHSMAALIKTSSSAAADEVVSGAAGGSLWGVSMGTTSEGAAYGEYALVTATNTRMHSLEEAAPEDVTILLLVSGIDAFTNRSDSEMFWSLLGAAEAE